MWAFAIAAEFPSQYCLDEEASGGDGCDHLLKDYHTDPAVWAVGGMWSLALTLANILCVFAVGTYQRTADRLQC